jgi:hypothetical protein
MKKIVFLVLFLFGWLYSQGPVKEPENVFDLLIHTWQYQSNPEYETWTKSETGYQGKVYSVMGADTTWSESCKIFKQKKNYFLEVDLLFGGITTPTLYKLDRLTSRSMLFKSDQSVFPQSIEYEWLENNYLRVTQTGLVDGKERSLKFLYTKFQ